MDYNTDISRDTGRSGFSSTGEIRWENRVVEVNYDRGPNCLNVSYGCEVSGSDEEYPVWGKAEQLWELTEPSNQDELFIKPLHEKLEFVEHDVYTGHDLHEVAEAHFHDIRVESVVQRVEDYMTGMVEAISEDGKPD